MIKKLLIILGIFIIIGGIATIFNMNKDNKETISIPDLSNSNVQEQLEIRYSNATGKSFDDVFYMEVTKESIIIKEKQRNSFLFWGVPIDSELEVLGKSKKVNNLEIDLVSTSLSIKDLEGEKFLLSSMSGDLELENVRANSIDGSTISSDIDLSNVTTNSMKLETTSGEMDLSTISTSTIHLETTSGEVDLSEVYGELQFTSVSGDVELNNQKLTNSISGTNVSGDILFSFAEKLTDVYFQGKTDSGAITFFHENISKVQLGAGSLNILLETVSGDITIE